MYTLRRLRAAAVAVVAIKKIRIALWFPSEVTLRRWWLWFFTLIVEAALVPSSLPYPPTHRPFQRNFGVAVGGTSSSTMGRGNGVDPAWNETSTSPSIPSVRYCPNVKISQDISQLVVS